jgi:hypothetical protein
MTGQQVGIAWGEPQPRKRGAKPKPNPTRKARNSRMQRARRQAAGLCVRCATPSNGKYYCDPCSVAPRVYARDRQRRLLAAGICKSCAKDPATGSGYCRPCYMKWREVKYAGDAKKFARGVCLRCHAPHNGNSSGLCQKHYDRKQKRANERKKEQRRAWLEAHPCSCGKIAKRRRRDGMAVCVDCSVKHGTRSGFEHSGCRCDLCRAFYRVYSAKRHAEDRAKLLAGRACACGQTDPHLMHIRADGRVQCAKCKNAETIPGRGARPKRPVKHGTVSAYANGGCRCEPCLVAHRTYRKARSLGPLATVAEAERGSQPGG